MDKLLEIKDLKTYFYTDDGIVKAVDGVNFSVESGKTIGIVGESGCGKSVTAMSILRLIPDPPGKIVNGEVLFDGKDLTKVSEDELRHIRGNDISVIFQEPMTSLNPVFTVGYQIMEALMLHQKLSEGEAKKKAIEMIKLVGIPRAEKIVDEYPHQLSGGMRQRVMIAMALSCQPKLLIADEPTTALDVTIQAQILELMNELKNKLNTSIMLITHDLGVVAEMSDHVIVMYSGKVVEDAPVDELFKNPRHPYTIGLMNSIPSLIEEGERLESIKGAVPNPLYLPKGCYFHPRCKFATDECRNGQPELREIAPGHKVSCFRAEEVTK
ncbi:ABC transporter ATP-binding protein [Anaerosalibacter bizertensis]|uniref:ABC transporter ATP-binding protein n=1 Tax=Anaerosalibacter bizertensis TaxID=932217 RepID=A0A844FE33_9FIRM|nr:ABC transporter ATP-binding protein [Anaerosalibacter bizertensis]MBV1818241.1 ABC transporter ATP-binding protein [Bacteroidales bacterium MSK.15.36]MCB5559392.1 ABC transporter ATP-binding protein [Anaerosalibacter bizertensis]MCG4564577.1 ABC transporter ATP-binding protein [Anaerosalibacter bizertensis]MCG4583074.1 ABC transporter ATP-binding protein [Anaerosalibacter bizertensis]MCG4584153.1 ABC transporter ATP-binding protein [Anaerosalibacter bizertensis]